jgi:hypothetical protein
MGRVKGPVSYLYRKSDSLTSSSYTFGHLNMVPRLCNVPCKAEQKELINNILFILRQKRNHRERSILNKTYNAFPEYVHSKMCAIFPDMLG